MKKLSPLLLLLAPFVCFPQIADLPLFDFDRMAYKGAFRVPNGTFGESNVNYSQGVISYNPDNHSIFLVGHDQAQAIAELSIPDLVNSTVLTDLNMATVVQNFVTPINHPNVNNSEALDRIGGLLYYPPALIATAYEYYDAPGDNTTSMFIIDDASDLANSDVYGMMGLMSNPAHIAGWISPVPSEYTTVLGGNFIIGSSSGIPIISRTSVGPSGFVIDVSGANNEPPTASISSTLLDFSLSNPLNADLDNSSFTNDVWTHLTRANYGFIVPNTRTYFTMGYSGGHTSGVCYKCTQNNGHLCGGYCAPDADDYYQYYWLWDMLDLIDVMNGVTNPYDVQPYDYGEFNTPFNIGYNQIGGGSYDTASNTLYVCVERGDDQQGQYANPPVIVAYSVNPATEILMATDGVTVYHNADEGDVIFEMESGVYTVNVMDANDNIYQSLNITDLYCLDVSALPSGSYFIEITDDNNINSQVTLQVK